MVKDVDVRYGTPWIWNSLDMELPGLNAGFFKKISCLFLLHNDCSIRVFKSYDFILVSVAVTSLFFNPSKGTATMISL